jgi:hypothetical protein
MSWFNDLVSSLGIPAGAAVLDVAMYAAVLPQRRPLDRKP